jgi:hypothetical protein
MRTALDSTGHRVPRTKPTCLLHTWRPHRRLPFALVLHLHQHQSSHNMHLQYLAKNQSTQRCQSLITPGSDHPPVHEPHMVLRNDALCSDLGCAGELPAKHRRAAPASGALATAPRTHESWTVGSMIHGVHPVGGIPLRCGPPWTRAPGSQRGSPLPWLLDQRSTAQSSCFLLRTPGLICFCMPVLPPIQILANRS